MPDFVATVFGMWLAAAMGVSVALVLDFALLVAAENRLPFARSFAPGAIWLVYRIVFNIGIILTNATLVFLFATDVVPLADLSRGTLWLHISATVPALWLGGAAFIAMRHSR
ncbi:MAG: hypothetical protein ABJF88_00410 [Rhodothermales bacterium]